MKVTEQLARELWDQTPHNWNGFRQTLQSDPDRFGNLDPQVRRRLEALASEMDVKGNGFPNSPQNLYEVLAEQLGASEPIA